MSATKAASTPAASERSPASSPASPARATLAQQLGNQGLQMLLRARLLQAKLSVSHPLDAYEQEADRVADHVMRMPASSEAPRVSPVQIGTTGDQLDRSGEAADVPTVDASTESSIRSLSGRGRALPESVRSFMEPRFGADFSAVRVHTDAHAHDLARAVSARAFTVGRNVVFGAGHYAPDTESGKHLLAHELTHVVQQTQPAAAHSSDETTSVLHRAPQAKKHKTSAKHAADDDTFTPMYLEDGSANEWAKRGAAVGKEVNAYQTPKSKFTYVVVTNGVYVYSDSGALLDQFPLTATPPILGLYIVAADEARQGLAMYRRGYDKHGKPTFREFGGWDPKVRSPVTEWSTMTTADEDKYFPGTLVMVIIPGHAEKQAAKSKPRPSAPLDPTAVPNPKATVGKGQGKTGDELKLPESGAEYNERKGKEANYPAFPAKISLSAGLVALSGANEISMHLDWTYGEKDMVGSVWNASTVVHYTWERWNVSAIPEFNPITRDAAADARRQQVRDADAKIDDQYLEHDRKQRIAELEEDIQNSRRTIKAGGTPGASPAERAEEVQTERHNLALAPVSGLKSAGGHMIESVLYPAFKPDNTIVREWNEEGLYLIRCIASPRDHRGHRYLPSVATAFVEVRSAKYIAENTLGAEDAVLDELRLKRKRTKNPWRAIELDEQIADLEVTAHGSAVEALAVAVRKKQKEIETAKGHRRDRLETELKSLSKELEIAKANEANIAPDADGKKRAHALRPQAAIASEVTGGTFPLLLQLVPLSHGPRPRWAIYDVTSKGDYLGHAYIGEGESDETAIGLAFKRFAGANDYGRGTVVLHIPDAVPNVSERDLVERNVRVGDALAKDRLHDLVTVLTAASLLVPGLGSAAVAITAGMAIEHIVERWKNGTLELDAELVTDLVAVFAAAGMVAGKVAGMMIVKAEGQYAIALESGDAAAIERALSKMETVAAGARAVELGNEIVSYGGIVWGKVQTLEQIQQINDSEAAGSMTHSAARSARAKAVLGAIQNDVMLFTGPLHEHSGGRTKEQSAEEPLRETQSRPAEPVRSEPAEHQPTTSEPTERTMAGAGNGPPQAPPPRSGPPPIPRAPARSPERLFELLERGVDRTLPPASTVEGSAGPPRTGEFRRGLTTADAAYAAYNEALAISGGREVGIYYDQRTGEYRVTMGTHSSVSGPAGEWIALVHYHPNPTHSLTLRLPAPADFHQLYFRVFRENATVREFVEYDIPGVGRGRTEFGIDPDHPDEPLYIRIHRPDGTVDPPMRFSGDGEYGRFWGDRKIYVEKGSPTYDAMLRDMYTHGSRLRSGRGTPRRPTNTRTAAGDEGSHDVENDTEITERTEHPFGSEPDTNPDLNLAAYEREKIGEFLVIGTKEMEGTALHRRISGLYGDKGPQRAIGPVLRLLEHLKADAKAVGARRLLITPEFVRNPNVLRVRRVIEKLGGTVRRISDGHIEIEIPLFDPDYVLDLRAHPRPTSARGEIDDSRTARPHAPGPQVPSGPKVVLHNEGPAPAILYSLPEGIRLITVYEGHAYYVSLGKSVSHIDGVESTKVQGAFYEFAGIQEVEPPRLPPGVELPDYDKIGKGWLIKAKGFTPIDPVPGLQEFAYRLEPGKGVFTRPEDVNDWLSANGAVPVLDFFRQVLGWE